MAEDADSAVINGDTPDGMVQEIFRMYGDGMGPGTIAAYLNARRGPGSAQRKWDTASLREIFSKWKRG